MPKIFQYILTLVINHNYPDEILGDYEELYIEVCKKYSSFIGFFWFVIQVIILVPVNVKNSFYWGSIMFSTYVKYALRNIAKNKLYSFINITGLAVGIASCILISLWVQNEVSYDRFHDNSERIYRVNTRAVVGGEYKFTHTSTPGPLVDELKERFPEVEAATHLTYYQETAFKYAENSFIENNLAFADNDFFKMFSFLFESGDTENPLSEPNTVVLSKSAAEKYFGNENPIGKIILFDNETNLKVTGVIRDMPENSSINYDFIISHIGLTNKQETLRRWVNFWPVSFVMLKPNTSSIEFNNKIKYLLHEFTDENKSEFTIQHLKDIHLYYADGDPGLISYLLIFGTIALFVLLIACINFMNLSTARSIKRAKEIGVRKVVGVSKNQLILQFLGESVVSAFLSLILALIISYFALPGFNEIANRNFSISFLIDPQIIIMIFGITLFAGLTSGIYPAFYLSSFQPVKIMKGLFKYGKAAQRCRTSLIVVQFTISILLIITTLIVSDQMDFIFNKNLGYNKKNILYINQNVGTNDKYISLRGELLANPDIVNITRAARNLTSTGNSSNSFYWEGKDPSTKISMNFDFTDFHYLDAMEIELADGEDFSNRYAYRDTVNVEFILNETAVKATGIEDPVGKPFGWGRYRKGFIKGVVKDYNFSSLQGKIKPLVLIHSTQYANRLYLRLNTSNLNNTVGYIKATWEKHIPGIPFKYGFLDERVESQYRSEKTISRICTNFSFISIILACLGVVGMISFITEQKTKEIGIRKTLGASVKSIVLLISKDFLKWVLAANIIAWPIAYYLMDKWLSDYAFRTEISIYTFLLATAVALIITFFTISFQSIKAAITNPVKSIRQE